MLTLPILLGLISIACAAVFDDCTIGQVEATAGDCQKYQVCESTAFGSIFGLWKEYSCPEGFYFNSVTTACLEAKDTSCHQKCAEKERISDENCVFFKECKNGTYSLFKCPRILSPEGSWSNQMFDPTSKKCINKQKLAIKGDCHAYKECVSIGPAFSIEYWRKASCPTSMHFSAATGVCLKTIESTCSSKVCSENTCQNGGICKEISQSRYECICKELYFGQNCELSNPCQNKPCLNEGTCFHSNNTHSFMCQCTDGWHGTKCEMSTLYQKDTLTGHKSYVATASFNNQGLLASGSGDGTIKVWNVSTGECLKTLTGHTSWVNSVAFDNQGLLASGSQDYTIKIWQIATGECLRTLRDHKNWVQSVSFNNQGLLASGSGDYTIKVWNVSTGECLKTLTDHTSHLYSVAFDNQGLLASVASDRTMKFWDLSTGKCLKTITNNNSYFSSLSFDNQGLLASGSLDGTIKVWNVSTGECIKTLAGYDELNYPVRILSVSFNNKGFLASGSDEGMRGCLQNTIKVWEVATGKCLKTIVPKIGRWWTNRVNSVAFDKQGVLANSNYDGTINLWKV